MLASAASADTTTLLKCRPALPYYCANIHIGCAGRSGLPTEPFTLSYATDGTLHHAGHAPVPLQVTRSSSGIVFRPAGSRDWIRVVADDSPDRFRFSQRIYRGDKALMTRGTCRRARGSH